MSIFNTDRKQLKQLQQDLRDMRESCLKLTTACGDLAEQKVKLLEEVLGLKQDLYACNKANKELHNKLAKATCILQSFASGETDEMIIAQEEAREFLKLVNRSVDNGNSKG